MGKITGFLEETREDIPERAPDERIKDWAEIYARMPDEGLKKQASRCMNCGVPFCHTGCPLGNIIPDWNHLVYTGQWQEAIDRLHATNNFPEFTGRICPAPCENACVLAINDDPVTIKQVEVNIVDRAWDEGWITPRPPAQASGKRVAIVGSGPAGLAAAQQLARAGHAVVVYERDDRIGGLLRYGIPEFKMAKALIDRRIAQMEAEGVEFRPGHNVGVDFPATRLKDQYDAIVLCGGATNARDLPIEGRGLEGIHLAMRFLTQANKRCEGDEIPEVQRISAAGKKVVVIGGGDTGADCMATSHRQGAAQVVQLELLAEPPEARAADNPWPEWARVQRTHYALKEGGERSFSVVTQRFTGENGHVKKLHCAKLEWVTPESGGRPEMREVEGSEFEIEAELVLLAIGFLGPEKRGAIEQLELELDARSNVVTDENMMTSVDGVFAAGDLRRGQSLVVWALAEGRDVAYSVDRYLMGQSKLEPAGAVIA